MIEAERLTCLRLQSLKEVEFSTECRIYDYEVSLATTTHTNSMSKYHFMLYVYRDGLNKYIFNKWISNPLDE